MRSNSTVLLAMLLASGVCLGGDLRVKEASTVELHGIEDYLEWVAPEALDEEARATIRRKVVFNAIDSVAANGNYRLEHRFQGEGVAVHSVLTLVPTSYSPEKAFGEFVEGMNLGVEEAGVKLVAFDCTDWVEECKYYLVRNKEGSDVGNMFLVRNKQTLYSVTIIGLSVFEDAESVRSFLETKSLAAFAFAPVSLVSEVEKEKQKIINLPKSAVKPGTSIALLVFYLLVYMALYWAAALINKLAGRIMVRRRALGLGGTFLLAAFLGVYVLWQVTKTGVMESLQPYDQGHLQGELVMTYLNPFIWLALGVGLSVWSESKRRRAGN